jgi:phosphoribosylglycinamide formyltransferase-1
MNRQFQLAIFASGTGTNAEEIIKYFKNHPAINVTLVLSNNGKAMVLDRVKKFNLPTKVFNREEFATSLAELLKEKGITHIVLAGFLWLIPQSILDAYPNRIINIHPALLPKFGGHGMYGMKIHELVRKLNEPETGITIHLVTENYDEGPILYQGKCNVTSDDTPVHELEHACYPKVIEKWILNEPIEV